MWQSPICGIPSPNGGDKAARTWGSRAPESPPMKPEEGRLAVAKVTDNQNGGQQGRGHAQTPGGFITAMP